MATNPVRVPEEVHTEVQAAARLLGCSAPELLERAWTLFRQSPEFVSEFELAQKAFSVGDLNHVTAYMHDQAVGRARRRSDAVRALRTQD
jgi:hypothetical protein